MGKRKTKSDSIIKDQKASTSLKKRVILKKLCLKIIHKCWMPFAIMVIIMAILFSLFRALTPWATQYKGEVEQHLSALVGQPVIISSMETSWYWFEPVLRLNQVTVSDSNDHALKLTKLLVGINLFSSLLHWHLQPGILYVDDVRCLFACFKLDFGTAKNNC